MTHSNSQTLSRDAHDHGGKHRKPRIKAAGSAVLEAFYSLHKRQPNDAEAKELLHRVQEVPGCQLFDMNRLHTWFYRKRRTLQQTNRFYPSLTPESMQHLKVLAHGQQHSVADDMISTWALLLKADVEDIKTWIMDNLLHSEEEPTPSPTELQPFQMPTPHNSTSPEPVSPKVKLPLLQHKEVDVLYQKFTDADINKIILDVVLNTTKDSGDVSETQPSKSPSNASEFGDMFTPYEVKMEKIINLLT